MHEVALIQEIAAFDSYLEKRLSEAVTFKDIELLRKIRKAFRRRFKEQLKKPF